MIQQVSRQALCLSVVAVAIAALGVSPPGHAEDVFQTNRPNVGALTLPPRNIDDIKEALNKSADGQINLSREKAVIKLPVPSSTDRQELASFYWLRGRAAVKLGLLGQAVDDLRLAASNSEGLDTHSVEDSRILQELAAAEFRAGNFMRAIVTRERALSRLSEGGRYIGQQMAMRRANARIYIALGEADKARSLLTKIDSLMITARGKRNWHWYQHNWLTHPAEVRADLLEYEGRYAEAEPIRRFILESSIKDLALNPERQRLGLTAPAQHTLLFRAARVTNRLANNLIHQQRYSEAEAIVRSELFRKLRLRGRNWMGTAGSLNKLSHILYQQGRHAEARELAELAIDVSVKANIPPAAWVASNSRRQRALALSAESRHREAVEEFERIEKIMTADPVALRVLGRGHPDWAISLIRTGRAQDALAMLDKLHKSQRQRFGDKNIRTVEVLGLKAMALAAAGQRTEALRLYAAALPRLRASANTTDGTQRSPTRVRRYRLIVESYLDLLVDLRQQANLRVNGVPVVVEAFSVADLLHARGVQQALTSGAARRRMCGTRRRSE